MRLRLRKAANARTSESSKPASSLYFVQSVTLYQARSRSNLYPGRYRYRIGSARKYKERLFNRGLRQPLE